MVRSAEDCAGEDGSGKRGVHGGNRDAAVVVLSCAPWARSQYVDPFGKENREREMPMTIFDVYAFDDEIHNNDYYVCNM